MPDVLIRTRDNHPDTMAYKRGDPVTVLPDGHVYGRLESLAVWVAEGRDPDAWPGGFVIVHVSGITLEEVRFYMQPGVDGNGKRYRRLYTIKNALDTGNHPEPEPGTNEVFVAWDDIKNKVKKKSGLSELTE